MIELPLSFSPNLANFFTLPTIRDFEELAEVGERVERLTPRQQAVIAWISHGKSNPEIVRILNSSRKIVDREITMIFDELGVENRMAASAIFIQWKLRRALPATSGAREELTTTE
ncbi:MAG: helix-turn-helix transcriptional regulator [Verrucomicrobiota bacterium]